SDDWYVAAGELTESAMTLGYVEEARGVADRVNEVAAERPMTAARVIATSRIATTLGVVGLFDAADALLAPIHRGEDAIGKEPAARAFFLSVTSARAQWAGDLERAALLAQEAVACFDVLGDARNAARQLLSAGWALLELGAYTAAESVLVASRAAADRLG